MNDYSIFFVYCRQRYSYFSGNVHNACVIFIRATYTPIISTIRVMVLTIYAQSILYNSSNTTPNEMALELAAKVEHVLRSVRSTTV